TKSPAKQNIEGSKKRNFCAGVEWTQTWTSGGGGYAAARRERCPSPEGKKQYSLQLISNLLIPANLKGSHF
ncbi:MAG: hypothetical protein VB110_00905, partial [Bacteroidales bacterium]|nr:hypothetical protein [Bacteroidales bacterium]